MTRFLDNCVVLTPLGEKYRDWLEELHAIQQSQAERTEELRVALRPGVDAGILVPAIAEFTRKFSFVALRVDFLSEGMREAVDSGLVAFAVTWEGSEKDGDCDRIEPPVPASVQIAQGHRLAGISGLIDADHFTPADHAFMAPGIAGRASELLRRVPPANRVEVACPEMRRRLVADGGVGIEFAHPSRSFDEHFTRLSATGVEPVSLGLILPRRRTLHACAEFLIGAIRSAVQDAAELPLPIPELPDLEFPLPEPLSA